MDPLPEWDIQIEQLIAHEKQLSAANSYLALAALFWSLVSEIVAPSYI